MKKISERSSFRKTGINTKKDQTFIYELPINDRRKSVKAKSSQKVGYQPQIHQQIKNSLKNHIRLKTDVDHITKTKFNPIYIESQDKMRNGYKFAENRKSQRKYESRLFIQPQVKVKQIQKLLLNEELFDSLKYKFDLPLSGKNIPNAVYRRQHDSHRDTKKRNEIQEYISASLENIKRKKSDVQSHSKDRKTNFNINKSTKIKQKMQKNVDETVTQKFKQKSKIQIHDQFNANEFYEQRIHLKATNRQSRLDKKEIHRKIMTEKDESLQKFQIKFQKVNKYDLSKEEIQMFGDRFPDGFDKIKLLGRGGFSLVWLGEHKKSKKKYAVKQILTQSSHLTHVKQIWFGTYFFEFGGAPKDEFKNHKGINNLVKLHYYFINKKDTWILYQKCGDSLGNRLYDLKPQKVNQQKFYKIFPKSLSTKIRQNQNQLRKILLQISKALELLAQNNIIHSDLKTENILIRQKTQDELQKDSCSCIGEVKLIDYGSSFVFNSLRQFSMATPQYMAPEILNFILFENDMQYVQKLLDYTQKYTKPWVIDMWSLGCVLLELISGVPLWMSLKTLIRKPDSDKDEIKYGLFAVKGRAFDKIIRKQVEVVQNLELYLETQNFSGIVLQPDLLTLLKRMLALNPQKRISPVEVSQFLQKSIEKYKKN